MAGQRATQPPSVNGWPQDRQWLSAQNLLDRANTVVEFTADSDDQAAHGMDVLPLAGGAATATAADDALVARLRVRATSAQRDLYVHFLDTAWEWPGVEVDAPWASADAEERRSRIRGLLWILVQNPTWQVR